MASPVRAERATIEAAQRRRKLGSRVATKALRVKAPVVSVGDTRAAVAMVGPPAAATTAAATHTGGR